MILKINQLTQLWSNNKTLFVIKLKDENNNVYWKLIDGENIYDINRML